MRLSGPTDIVPPQLARFGLALTLAPIRSMAAPVAHKRTVAVSQKAIKAYVDAHSGGFILTGAIARYPASALPACCDTAKT